MKTFGSVKLSKDRKTWAIECEPHIVMRLKRVFPKVSRKAHGTIRVTNTIDTCRELDWFMERFPLEMTEADRATLTGESNRHREQESIVAELLSGVRQPSEYRLALQPRAYQRIAADMAFTQGGLLLADDLGLGKTCSGICLLSRAECRPALVVTMTHLTYQWEQEIHKFVPAMRTHVLRKGTPYDLRHTKRTKPGQLMLTPETPDVIITNYHKLSGWADVLAPIVNTVIYDEAQELRHNDSAKYKAAEHISNHTRWRIGLTATPIYNYGDELFHVANCIMPGRLGTKEEFIEEWCKEANARSFSISDPKAFGCYARDSGLMLQRTRAEVGRELPSLTKIPTPVECNSKALEAIEGAAGELARIIMGETEEKRGQKMHASEELSGLVRQATGIAKAPYVAAFVRMLVESGKKVVLWGWHRAVYDLWLDALKDLRPVLYTGSESATQKDAARLEFIEGDAKVLVMSLRSGAGLDGLQDVCDTGVFGELDWSPGVHDQCGGRIHRDGQPNPVFLYFMIANEGSDPIVSDVLGLKKAQADGVMGERDDLLDSSGANIKALAQMYLAGKAAA